MTSRQVRTDLAETLELDPIGPGRGHACERELLGDFPTQWYLTGYLVPVDADLETRLDGTADDDLEEAPVAGGFDDNSPVDRSAAGANYLPSSMGLTVMVAGNAEVLEVEVTWGDYAEEKYMAMGENGEPKEETGYRRTPKEAVVRIPLAALQVSEATPLRVPDSRVGGGESGGLILSCICRSVPEMGGLPAGCRAVTVFLVNQRTADRDRSYRTCAFQAKLRVSCAEGLVGRPDLRGLAAAQHTDPDHDIADLHYRDVLDYAVGHGVSVIYDSQAGAGVRSVETSWVPRYEVERVLASGIPEVEFGMQALAACEGPAALGRSLRPLVAQYRQWLEARALGAAELASSKRRDVAQHLINDARAAADRIEEGIALLETDRDSFRAFTLANRCMLEAAARRLSGMARDSIRWRPFQLAFILLNLPGLADPAHGQRKYVELLFFPTGGGKTEAYLGLAAFQLVHRRLTYPGIRSAGVSVLMRYTLRLLTLDQLGRAAALICALELERRRCPAELGAWPFEIGLWVGSAATPNRLGHQGYSGPGADQTAYIRTKRYRENHRANPAPIPLESCPWCEARFDDKSFRMAPSEKAPTNLQIICRNYECEFSQGSGLPILTVDEPIYRRLPCFLIATVDKFAALPWEGRAGALLGRVNRYDNLGFYGPMDGAKGSRMDDVLPGPDLIIQDELHLISGPLGTIAGVYETAISKLCERYSIDGQNVRVPKIIASTATVRRASRQIQALFGRPVTRIFPPPGIHRNDSFFARTVPIQSGVEQTNGRLYLGIAAQGRSLKKVFLRVALAVMSRAQALYAEGAPGTAAADPYMTLLGYFNSLRELGGSRRIVEDEVLMQLDRFASRRRLDPDENRFACRSIDMSQIRELTSRVSTKEVAETKEKMGKPHAAGEGCDVVLATNMISVGLDVTRLGLMLVLGQPKGSSEYIQATSRVGREVTRPGLVITLLNPHKPRDRSHFEQFQLYHQSFYRSVEATSVTPFSPRALDRALGAAMVGMIRHALEPLTPALGAQRILSPEFNARLDGFCQLMAERARDHRQADELPSMPPSDVYHYVLNRCRAMVDDWKVIATEWHHSNNSSIQYQREDRQSGAAALLHDFLDTAIETLPTQFRKFRANRSMRDVETSTELSVRELNEPITGSVHAAAPALPTPTA